MWRNGSCINHLRDVEKQKLFFKKSSCFSREWRVSHKSRVLTLSKNENAKRRLCVWPVVTPRRQRSSSSESSSHGLPASCSHGSSSALSGNSDRSSRLQRLLLSARRYLWDVGNLPLGLCSELTPSIKPFLHTRLLTCCLQSRLWEEGLSDRWSSFRYSELLQSNPVAI